MGKISACDRCDYRPRTADGHVVVLNDGVDEYSEPIVYVRCYNCGHEWVE